MPPSDSDTSAPESAEMEDVMQKVVVQRAQSPTFQISTRIRQMIQDAELIPGMKLPPTRRLAAQLSVDPSAVHRSLAQLVKEGLLIRTPRVGTFVASPPGRLERLAFYHRVGGGFLSAFERAVLTEISRVGHRRGFSIEVFSDTRKPELSASEPHAELIRMARTRWVQGVVSCGVSPEQIRWFNSLPVPRATLSTPDQPHTLNWDRETNVETAIRQLAARGCRRIGMISPLRLHEDARATAYELGQYTGLTRTLAKLGLPFRPEWIAGLPPGRKSIAESQLAAFGFESLNHLWDRPENASERPDGLFVYPDIAAQGALVAIALKQIRIPQQLRLVFHVNAEIPIFCPFPVDRLVVSAADAATALVDHVVHQLTQRGQPPSRTLPVRLDCQE